MNIKCEHSINMFLVLGINTHTGLDHAGKRGEASKIDRRRLLHPNLLPVAFLDIKAATEEQHTIDKPAPSPVGGSVRRAGEPFAKSLRHLIMVNLQ